MSKQSTNALNQLNKIVNNIERNIHEAVIIACEVLFNSILIQKIYKIYSSGETLYSSKTDDVVRT